MLAGCTLASLSILSVAGGPIYSVADALDIGVSEDVVGVRAALSAAVVVGGAPVGHVALVAPDVDD